MAFIIATFVTVAIAFVVVGFIFIPYFYGCKILWQKQKLIWKIILPIIYVASMWFAIEYELFPFVFRLVGIIDWGGANKMPKENLKLIITELKNAELQEDGTIKVKVKYDQYAEGTVNYGDFRCFCEELIRKIRTA